MLGAHAQKWKPIPKANIDIEYVAREQTRTRASGHAAFTQTVLKALQCFKRLLQRLADYHEGSRYPNIMKQTIQITILVRKILCANFELE